mgnify:CR=1 FL=1
MNNELVTIGITCFNAENSIVRAINSAIKQDWQNIEILIVDDVSNDNSVELVEKVIQNDNRARLIKHTVNKGPAGARNTIIKEAKGGYIVFFDDDDESLAIRVSEQVNCIKKYQQNNNTDLIACYASGVRYYNNGYELALPAIGSRNEGVKGNLVAHYLLFFEKRKNVFYGSGTPTCSLCARTDTFKQLGGFDESLRRVEDADFAVRLSLKGGVFIGTKKLSFIQYSTQAKDKSYEKNLESEQILIRKHQNYLKSVNRFYYALHWPKLRYWHFKKKYGCFLLTFLGLIVRNPLITLSHIFVTGPARLLHEYKMTKNENL